jgi:hypothetical protein
MPSCPVPIFAYKVWDIKSGSYKPGRYKATEEAIKRFGAVRIDDTAEEVDASLLDEEGRYARGSDGS